MKFLKIMLIMLLPISVGAQQQIDIDSYMQRVVDYSQQLKIARENTFSAESQQSAVKTGFLPRVDAGADFSYMLKKTGFEMSGTSLFMKPESYQTQVALSQNVYSGQAVRNQYKIAEINTDIAKTSEEMTLDEVEFSAESSYWTLAANAEILRMAKQYIDIVTQLQTIITERFNGGLISRTDVMMVETRMKEAEFQYANSLRAYKVALQNFNILMGDGVNTHYIVSDTIRKVIAMPHFLTLDSVLAVRPDYRIAQKRVDSQGYGVKLSRAKYNPQLSVGVQGQWGTQSLNFNGDTKLNGVTYAKLTVPIFHWGERRKTTGSAKAQLRSSEFQLQATEDMVSQELNNTIVSIQENYNQLQIADASLAISSENLMLNTFSYNEGKLTVLDVLSAQGSWLQSYLNAISANYNYKVALAQYRKVVSADL